MNLTEISMLTKTDKNTVHSYLNLYEELLSNKRNTATHILEVGIHNDAGSIELWDRYFTNAQVYGVDIKSYNEIINDYVKNSSKITLLTSVNAYNNDFVNSSLKDIKFDFILDDGSHNLVDMIKFIELYLPLVKDDGILIIEDVSDINWIQILCNAVPENHKKYIIYYDFRPIKNRYDDIVFTINKTLDV
jgi:hypothetical protein